MASGTTMATVKNFLDGLNYEDLYR
jgi:hypothetical protein